MPRPAQEQFVRQHFFIIASALTCGSICASSLAQAPLGMYDGAAPSAMAPQPAAPQAATSDAASIDGCQVIARIEGQVVLACDVLWKINKLLETRGAQIPPEQLPAIRQGLMQNAVAEMIDRKIIYAEFRRNFPPENLPRLEESLQQMFEDEEAPRIMKDLGVDNRQDMERELVRLGSSLADVKRAFNEKAVVSTWVRSKVKFNEEVTPGDMLAFYREHQADYEYPTQVRWEELVVRKSRYATPAESWAELAHMGNEVWNRAAQVPGGIHGPAFAEVAKARSDGLNAKEGGQYNWTTKGALKATAIDDALFTLQVGQMSLMLESDTAFHIVRVLERKEAGRQSFAEVQKDIRDKLKEERFQKAVTAYLGKIHQNARVWTEQTGDVTAETFIAQVSGAGQKR